MTHTIKPRIFYISAYVVLSMVLPVAFEVMRMQYMIHTWTTERLELFIGFLPPLVLGVLIWRRSFHRILPALAIYVGYLFVVRIIELTVSPHVIATRLGFGMALAEPLLQIFLIYAILRRLCRQFPRFLQAANWLFIAALSVMVGLGMLAVWHMRSDPGFSQGGMHGAAMIGWNVVICGLILFVLIIKWSLALPADHPLLLIVVGLGVLEAFEVIGSPVFMYYGIHRLISLYAYEAISGGTGALEFALWFLAILHYDDAPSETTQLDLEFTQRQVNEMNSAFARLIYKR